MELRKDPITQSWVILGQKEVRSETPEECPLEPAKLEKLRSIMTWPTDGAWQVRVLPHPEPLYHIEGAPGREAGETHRGCAGRLLCAVPVCVTGALRSLGDAPAAQPLVRAA